MIIQNNNPRPRYHLSIVFQYQDISSFITNLAKTEISICEIPQFHMEKINRSSLYAKKTFQATNEKIRAKNT